jgi:hypothetical protein
MATPHVTGAAALYVANNPGAAPAEVKAALIAGWEPGPIAGDPDGIGEGILNLNDGSTTSNQAPVAQDDSAITNEDSAATIDVLANDTDPDGDALTVSAATQGANGAVSIDGGASVTYTPNAGFSGNDTFTYTVDDGHGGTDTGTVAVTVNPVAVNTAPVATDDSASTTSGQSVIVAVLANDHDAEGDALSVTNLTQPTSGAANVTLNGDGTVSYSPNADFAGSDSFTYTANDGALDSNVATITVTVIANAVLTPPAAPSNLAAGLNNDGTAIVLTWTDDADNETSYRVYRYVNGNGDGVLLADGLPADTTTYQDSDLTSSRGRYNYYVVAVNDAGESARSNTARVRLK